MVGSRFHISAFHTPQVTPSQHTQTRRRSTLAMQSSYSTTWCRSDRRHSAEILCSQASIDDDPPAPRVRASELRYVRVITTMACLVTQPADETPVSMSTRFGRKSGFSDRRMSVHDDAVVIPSKFQEFSTYAQDLVPW